MPGKACIVVLKPVRNRGFILLGAAASVSDRFGLRVGL